MEYGEVSTWSRELQQIE